MTRGVFRRDYRDGAVVCSCGPDGWVASRPGLAAHLETLYPTAGPPAAGAAWVAAFHAAARAFGARVLAAPAADPSPPGTIH